VAATDGAPRLLLSCCCCFQNAALVPVVREDVATLAASSARRRPAAAYCDSFCDNCTTSGCALNPPPRALLALALMRVAQAGGHVSTTLSALLHADEPRVCSAQPRAHELERMVRCPPRRTW